MGSETPPPGQTNYAGVTVARLPPGRHQGREGTRRGRHRAMEGRQRGGDICAAFA